MRFGVVVFPGSNCDRDAYHVVRDSLGQEASYIWHNDSKLDNFDCLILPGGFSYGDYLRAGAIARFAPIMEEVQDFAKGGGLVLGICNGFQTLLEALMLPGAMRRNKTLSFICKDVHIRAENVGTPYTSGLRVGEVLRMPIAHAEGNYYVDDDTLKGLVHNNQIVFRYCDSQGNVADEANPNGSLDNIAGICNREGNVLGMMPHPERASERMLGSEDGRKIFRSIIESVRERCK
jgi:phosphoribosylformylglycinamidine synthase